MKFEDLFHKYKIKKWLWNLDLGWFKKMIVIKKKVKPAYVLLPKDLDSSM